MTFLTHEELVREEVELLPSRETLALLNGLQLSATNVALASNTLSFASLAAAQAHQAVLVSQT